MTPALTVHDAWRRLARIPVLQGLTLSVDPGECRALVGMNGVGKSTALRAMLGLLRLDHGTVHLLGHDVQAPHREFRSRLGHLVEMPFCSPELTARENILFAARLRGVDPRSADRRCEELSEALGLTRWLDQPARRLSLGTRQKVGLIAALVHRPRLVLLDEPTNGLDPLAVVALRRILTDLTDSGTAVLVTGHHLDEIARLADQVDVMHHGRIIDTLSSQGTDLERAFFEIVLAAETSRLPEQPQ